jgi:RNA polymerase-binding transcription factor DksA
LLADLAANAAQIAALESDRARLIEAAQSSNADDEHDPEGATIAFEREQLTALLQRALRSRDELGRALEQDDQGRYGQCEGCGQPIDPDRLEARPHARLCISCARSDGARRRG